MQILATKSQSAMQPHDTVVLSYGRDSAQLLDDEHDDLDGVSVGNRSV